MKKFTGYLAIFLFMCFLLAMTYFHYGFFWEYDEAESSMNEYLEKKYKDEFAQGDIRFDWRNGGSYYTYASADATGSEFYIEISRDNKFFDGYAYEYWAYEGVRLVKPIVAENLVDYDGIAIDLFFDKKIQSAKVLKGNLESVSWEVFINAPYELDQTNVEDEMDDAFNLLKDLEANNFQLKKMEILYIGKSLVLMEDELAGINDSMEMEEYLVEGE